MGTNKTATIKLEQNGEIIEAGTNFGDFKVFGLEGLTGLEFDFSMTSTPQSPNSVISNIKPLPRQIEMKMHCFGNHRQFLNRFFNPFNKGKMTVTWDDTTRWIEYYPHPVKIVQQSVYRKLEVSIMLICPEPYWRDMVDYGKDIASKQELLAFPFVLMPKKGLVCDYRLFNTDVSIYNGGDVAVGAKIIFKALGSIKNPKLILNNNEYLRVIVNMVKGDVVEFNTHIDNIYVTKNGNDILNESDPAMSFFQIPMGENIIKFEADEGTANLQVFVYYTPLYVSM